MKAFDETDADRLALRQLLDELATLWGSQASLARLVGVADATISQWIAGRRGLGWFVVLAASRGALRLRPELVVDLVEAAARILLGAHGRWVPEDALDPRRGLSDRALEIGDLAGDVAGSVRRALADGHLDEDERVAIHDRAAIAARRCSELAAATAAEPARRKA